MKAAYLAFLLLGFTSCAWAQERIQGLMAAQYYGVKCVLPNGREVIVLPAACRDPERLQAMLEEQKKPPEEKVSQTLTVDQKAIALAILRDKSNEAAQRIAGTHDDISFLVFPNSPLTPLQLSARLAQPDVVAALLDHAIGHGSADEAGKRAALTETISSMHATGDDSTARLQTIQVLLDHGVDLAIRDKSGYTALGLVLPNGSGGSESVRKFREEVAKALIAAGADINEPVVAGRRETYLSRAIKSRNKLLVDFLLAHGADPRAGDSAALAAAVDVGDVEQVRSLLAQGLEPSAHAYSSGDSMLASWLTTHDGGPILDMLLDAGADPNGCRFADADGACDQGHSERLLALAMDRGDRDLATKLLAKGANPNMLEWVLARKPAVYPRAPGGPAVADKFDRVASVQMLLDAGADPNLHSGQSTPLELARRDAPEAVQLLLDHGARARDPILFDNSHIGPITRAIVAGQTTRVAAEIQRKDHHLGYDERFALHAAVAARSRTLVKALIGAGADPNAGGPLGETPLHVAAMHQGAEMIDLLVASGADLDSRSSLLLQWRMHGARGIYALIGYQPHFHQAFATPLMVAAENGNVAAVKALLGRGANRKLDSLAGLSAHELAEQNQHEEIARLLR